MTNGAVMNAILDKMPLFTTSRSSTDSKFHKEIEDDSSCATVGCACIKSSDSLSTCVVGGKSNTTESRIKPTFAIDSAECVSS
mgnify:CR=1 FL=1